MEREPIHQILDRLDAVLSNERVAIRRLDGAGVEAAAAEKAALVNQLVTQPSERRAAAAGRIADLARQLRRNGVLLVHARGIMRDVLRLRGAQMPSRTHGFAAPPPVVAASRLSIRG